MPRFGRCSCYGDGPEDGYCGGGEVEHHGRFLLMDLVDLTLERRKIEEFEMRRCS
jgi:hypothetical protein